MRQRPPQSTAIVIAMRAAFREFWPAVPGMLKWWAAISVPLLIVMFVLGGQDIGEAAVATAYLLPLFIPFFGLVWLDPLSDMVSFSLSRFLFALLWFAVTIIPAIGVAMVVSRLLSAVFGVAPCQLPVCL